MFEHGANSLLKYLSGLCGYSNVSMVTYHPIGWLQIHSDSLSCGLKVPVCKAGLISTPLGQTFCAVEVGPGLVI